MQRQCSEDEPNTFTTPTPSTPQTSTTRRQYDHQQPTHYTIITNKHKHHQVGTFTLFQETYHRPTFRQMHVSGPKSDYDHRLLSQDRAMIGGVDDVGIGALFGLVRGAIGCCCL